ncbi:MAG: Sec-independent protein translocase protein TatB [Methyloceanibacter sp.]
MLEIGWSELLVIAVVAIVVVGPKELPRLMRTFGHYAGKLRRAAADFQRQFEEAMREEEAEEVRKNIESIRASMGSFAVNEPAMLPKPKAETPSVPSPEPVASPVSRKRAPSTTKSPKAKSPKAKFPNNKSPRKSAAESKVDAPSAAPAAKKRAASKRQAKAEPQP